MLCTTRNHAIFVYVFAGPSTLLGLTCQIISEVLLLKSAYILLSPSLMSGWIINWIQEAAAHYRSRILFPLRFSLAVSHCVVATSRNGLIPHNSLSRTADVL